MVGSIYIIGRCSVVRTVGLGFFFFALSHLTVRHAFLYRLPLFRTLVGMLQFPSFLDNAVVLQLRPDNRFVERIEFLPVKRLWPKYLSLRPIIEEDNNL